jgi:hypothetical protein
MTINNFPAGQTTYSMVRPPLKSTQESEAIGKSTQVPRRPASVQKTIFNGRLILLLYPYLLEHVLLTVDDAACASAPSMAVSEINWVTLTIVDGWL